MLVFNLSRLTGKRVRVTMEPGTVCKCTDTDDGVFVTSDQASNIILKETTEVYQIGEHKTPIRSSRRLGAVILVGRQVMSVIEVDDLKKE